MAKNRLRRKGGTMALTRKFLSALGIEADKVDEIITAHTETVDGLKDEIEKYRADAEKLPSVQKELDELKKDGGKEDSYKLKYEKVKEDFDNYKNEVEADKTNAKKSNAYKKLLNGAGISDKVIDKIISLTKLDDLELDGDDIKDADKVTDSIKEEWADFIVKERTEGSPAETPPKGTGKKMTKDEIMAIKDPMERQKAIADNHEVFNF